MFKERSAALAENQLERLGIGRQLFGELHHVVRMARRQVFWTVVPVSKAGRHPLNGRVSAGQVDIVKLRSSVRFNVKRTHVFMWCVVAVLLIPLWEVVRHAYGENAIWDHGICSFFG